MPDYDYFHAAQEVNVMARQNEIGHTICERPNGEIVSGPVAEGGPVSVEIPLQCPAGSRYVGLWHTHPGGIPYPSSVDIRTAQLTRAEKMCISVPETGVTKCYNVRDLGRSA